MVIQVQQKKRSMDNLDNHPRTLQVDQHDTNSLVATLAFECTSNHRPVSREGARASREDPVYFSHEKHVTMVKKIPKAKCVVLPEVLPDRGPIAWPVAASEISSPTASLSDAGPSPNPTGQRRPAQQEPPSTTSRDGNINPQHVSIKLKADRSPGAEALFEIEECPASPEQKH
eukprot:760918-Hanusia_phi.AAC.2